MPDPLCYRIGITLPPNRGVGTGNLRTAQRWQKILSELGHEVAIVMGNDVGNCEVLIALNAVKSFEAISHFHQKGQGKLIVAVTGTDLNRRESAEWRQAMEWADRIVVLQQNAQAALEPELRVKSKVILQSVIPLANPGVRAEDGAFQICVVGHLRSEKDPMLTAFASRLLDAESSIQIRQAGAILEERYVREVEDERFLNPRYQWLGELGRMEAQRLISQSDLMVLSSTSEGGPGVIGEAVVAGTPILSTRIDGVIGLLGEDYPGYFEPGEVMALSKLLAKVESQEDFYLRLKVAVERRQNLFRPVVEKESWLRLIQQIGEVD